MYPRMIQKIQGILCYLLIASCSVTSVQCSDDDSENPENTVPEEDDKSTNCRPAVLAGAGGLLYVTYNADSTVKLLTSPAYADVAEYKQEYLYTDGKRTRMNLYAGGKIIGYSLLTYTATKIIESAYEYMDDQVYQSRYYIHYREGDRIFATVDYTVDGRVRYDSVYFTYTNDNITRANGYGANDKILYYNIYEYDANINPYALLDIRDYQGLGFLPVSRSKNNITRIEYHYEEYSSTSHYNYTYDENGLPLTYTDEIQTLNFEYVCN